MNFTPVFIKTKEKNGNPIQDTQYAPVSLYMVPDVITFNENQPIHEVIDGMLHHKISGGPVVNNQNELVGIISEKDCLKVLIDEAYYNNPCHDRTVKDYMSTDVITVQEETDLIQVAKSFINSSFRRYPVINQQGKLVGQVSRNDILKAVGKIHSTTWH